MIEHIKVKSISVFIQKQILIIITYGPYIFLEYFFEIGINELCGLQHVRWGKKTPTRDQSLKQRKGEQI